MALATAAPVLAPLSRRDQGRPAMATTPCPSCRQPKGPGKYLCWTCWGNLPGPARKALSRRDSKAMARLQELHRQLAAGVPLAEIAVTP
ncbi:hypothetical protein [Streptomyces sp. NPDC051636]|uniref:hypothetical protein n=1 Tax=Streptomyces sp. NPDC051636 TaxID=3365663 RepID=UPI00378B8506